jgi:hypothetical protein
MKTLGFSTTWSNRDHCGQTSAPATTAYHRSLLPVPAQRTMPQEECDAHRHHSPIPRGFEVSPGVVAGTEASTLPQRHLQEVSGTHEHRLCLPRPTDRSKVVLKEQGIACVLCTSSLKNQQSDAFIKSLPWDIAKPSMLPKINWVCIDYGLWSHLFLSEFKVCQTYS